MKLFKLKKKMKGKYVFTTFKQIFDKQIKQALKT